MDTEAGKFRRGLPFIFLPGERSLVVLGQRMPREMLSSYARGDLRRTVMELSGEEKVQSLGRENLKENVDVRAAGDGTVSEKANTRFYQRQMDY